MHTTCVDLKGFPNIGNSCYLDSILFALFATPNAFIDRHILKARKLYGSCNDSVQEKTVKAELQFILQSIANHFRNEKDKSVLTSCQTLKTFIRKYRQACPFISTYPNFSNSNQQEALEFLQFILSAFGLNGNRDVGNHLKYKKRYGVGTKISVNWLPWFSRIDKKSSVVHYVPYSQLKKPKKSTSRFLETDDVTYDLQNTIYKKCPVNVSQEITKYTKFSDFFVIAVDRINPFTSLVLHSNITIDLHLPNTRLQLDAVIMHIGESMSSGHYVCLKRCQNIWVLYDDLNNSLLSFSSWTKVLKYQKGLVRRNSVLFFYTE
jgi:hypothetical protein